MKKINCVLSVLLFSFLVFSCTQPEQKESCTMEGKIEIITTDVTPKEFQTLISSEVILLDVRTPEEFNGGHIENSININFLENDFLEKVSELDKSKNILVYCEKGGRSGKAMRKLSENGFSTVYNLVGGFTQWKKEELPFVK